MSEPKGPKKISKEDERRNMERIQVVIDVRWVSLSGQQKGTISDISASGCFILTSGEVFENEPLIIEIKLPDEEPATLPGEAVYHTTEIGFALRFTEMDETEKHFLQHLLNYSEKHRTSQ